MKQTWLILENIVNKGVSKCDQSTFKINEDTITNDKAIISADHITVTVYGRTGIQKLILGTSLSKKNRHDIQKLKTFSPRTWRNYHSSFTISPPKVHVMDLSLVEGIFPDELKIAKVLPLYISDNLMLFHNYRPVSLLKIITKVFQKVMYARLVSFLENQKIVYTKQLGYQEITLNIHGSNAF